MAEDLAFYLVRPRCFSRFFLVFLRFLLQNVKKMNKSHKYEKKNTFFALF